jgi:hypothetical protein
LLVGEVAVVAFMVLVAVVAVVSALQQAYLLLPELLTQSLLAQVVMAQWEETTALLVALLYLALLHPQVVDMVQLITV